MSVTYIWLIAGVALIVFDTLHLGGVGLMFLGLGAVTAGAALQLEFIATDAYVTQCLIFFASTALWALLLWKPVQKFRTKRPGGYDSIIGQTGYVGSNGLSKKSGGEVTWSGTIMKAQLAKTASVDTLEAGSQVTILDVTGATLIVTPKSPS